MPPSALPHHTEFALSAAGHFNVQLAGIGETEKPVLRAGPEMTAMQVELIAFYNGDADEVFADALRFEEMEEAMRGLAVYEGGPKGAVRGAKHI